MRILFCNYEYPPLGGGGGVVNALLAEELARRHEVTVLTSQGLGLSAEQVAGGVRIIRVPVLLRKRADVASLPSLLAFLPCGRAAGRRLLRRERYDLINTHFALPSGPVGDALARAAGMPHVLSLHGGDLYDPSKRLSPHRHPLLRAWIRRLVRRADRVVGQSRNTIDNLHRFYAPEIEAARIPLGIRRPPGDVASRAAYGIKAQDPVLVTVGRLVARKAVDQLIAVMQALPPSVRLLVIGSGPEEPRLRRDARQRGVQHRVVFTGRIDEPEKFQLLRMGDAYVSASQHEGFGLTFLEAMACGLPVVCYDHGGQTDFLADGQTGFVIRCNDTERFAQRCRELIARSGLRQRLGAENLRRVEELFIDRCAERYEAVFAETLAAHRLRRNGRASSIPAATRPTPRADAPRGVDAPVEAPRG